MAFIWRINNAAVADCCKQLILLPPHHRFTELFIREKHFKVLHNGIRDTLNAVRETHWILWGREAVKKVSRKCVICKRYEGKSVSSPPLTQLPEERVGEYPPFANTGIDFAGPLYIKSDGKVYVCLFTCGITRAIHLELTTDLSASSFLQAFRCFVGRRGLPTKIISDNAKQLQRIFQRLLDQQLLDNTSLTERCLGSLLWRKPPGGGFLGKTC